VAQGRGSWVTREIHFHYSTGLWLIFFEGIAEKLSIAIIFKMKKNFSAKTIAVGKNAADGFSGFFLLLPEDVVRINNRGKRTCEHRDQDEPDGKVRDQRAGTAHDTGNLE
jgi:hypothetical protein